jgi:hypothetical protein
MAPLGLVARPGREDERRVRLYTLDPEMLKDLARRYNPAGVESESFEPSSNLPTSVDNRRQASTSP